MQSRFTAKNSRCVDNPSNGKTVLGNLR